MTSITCPSSRWWSEISADNGLTLLDQHVDGNSEWSRVAATGLADWQRAHRLAGIPTGNDLNLLEIGCGAGRMTGVLASHYREVVAVDVSESYLRRARRNCPAANVTFRAIEGDGLQVAADRQYDVAFSYEVFHYLAPPLLDRYFDEVHRLLRPGGQFVFELNTEPLRWTTRLSIAVRRFLHACGKRSWRGWPTSPHFVRKVYSAEVTAGRLQQAGFSVSQIINPGRRETWFVATKSHGER